MERRLLIWTDASPKEWKRAKYTYRGVSPTGAASEIMSGEVLEANQASAILEALIASLKEFSGKQKQLVCVVCSCPPVLLAINQKLTDRWETNGYISSRGKPVEHADLWKEATKLSEEKQIELTARAPDAMETEIMYEMGAGYFRPQTNLA